MTKRPEHPLAVVFTALMAKLDKAPEERAGVNSPLRPYAIPEERAALRRLDALAADRGDLQMVLGARATRRRRRLWTGRW
jgi:hypothetical protein